MKNSKFFAGVAIIRGFIAKVRYVLAVIIRTVGLGGYVSVSSYLLSW